MSEGRGKGTLLVVAAALMLLPSTAHAYLGPGGVLTAIGAMLALFVAIVAAIAGFLWYPLKRLLAWMRRLRGRPDAQVPRPTSETIGR
jgi:membrane protein implicated in regulation of membrane protease activity